MPPTVDSQPHNPVAPEIRNSVAPQPQPPVAPQPQPSVAPQPRESAAPQPRNSGQRLRVANSVSMNLAPINTADILPSAAAEERPIDQQLLEQYWAEAMDHFEPQLPKIVAAIRNQKLQLDGPDQFKVNMPNYFVVAEARPHVMQLLEFLRQRAGRPNLNLEFNVVYEEREAVVYSARDKYDVMAEANPMLATFKVLFPEVDL